MGFGASSILRENIMAGLAVLFPGQGSQFKGMLAEFIEKEPSYLSFFNQASEVLGYDLWQLISEDTNEQLNQTQFTQPAILVVSVVLWHFWQSKEAQKPNYLAGHSLGEYSALVCANAIDFQEAVLLVAQRGRFMQEAVPIGQGAMAACIGLDEEAVRSLCLEASEGDVLSPANFNSPGQIVVAGSKVAVDRFIPLAKAAKAKLVKQLPVSVPSHCALMKEAAGRLSEKLNKINIKAPLIPVIHNVDFIAHSHPDDIRAALIAQLENPVQWVATIKRFVDENISEFIECGPGNVLAGLNKRMAREASTVSIQQRMLMREVG